MSERVKEISERISELAVAKRKLVDEQMRIQNDLSKIRLTKTESAGRVAEGGKYMSRKKWTALAQIQIDNKSRLLEINRELAPVKKELADLQKEKESIDRETFGPKFKAMAKLMLPPETYDMLVAATIGALHD